MSSALESVPEIGEVDEQSKLESIAQSRACEEGRAVALDFGSIRTRLGDRWPSRREGVWDHVHRAIVREGGRDVLYRRLDETHFLLAFSEQSGPAAVSLGLNIMEGVLTHFLGKVSEADRVVRMVTSVEGEEIQLAPPRPAEDRSFAGSKTSLWSAIEPPSIKAPCPIVEGHPGLEVKIGVEEVFDLRAQAVLGRRMACSIYDQRLKRVLTHQEVAALPTAPLLAIGNDVLDAVEGFLARPGVPVIIVPVLLQAFASSRLRLATLEKIHGLAKHHRGRIIFEITGIDGGTPVARVQEAMSLLKPVCRAIFCRARPVHSALEVLREAGARGVAVSSREIGADGERLSAGLMSFGSAAKAVAPLRMATGLDHRSQLSICALAGYTHASIAVPAED